MNIGLDNNTQRYRDVYSNFNSGKQFNLRTDLPLIENKQYELFTTKSHKIKEYPKSNILDLQLGEIDTRPDFSMPKPLSLADKIGKAVVREETQNEYEKMLLENQARDVEQYMAQNYLSYNRIEKDLRDNNKNEGQIMEIVPEYNLIGDKLQTTYKIFNKGANIQITPHSDISIQKDEPQIEKKKVGRPKGSLNKKTIAKELQVATSLPSIPILDIPEKPISKRLSGKNKQMEPESTIEAEILKKLPETPTNELPVIKKTRKQRKKYKN